MKLSKHDDAFYGGIMVALNLLYMHDAQTIFDELIDLVDKKKVLARAILEGDEEWSGLVKYGYLIAPKE